MGFIFGSCVTKMEQKVNVEMVRPCVLVHGFPKLILEKDCPGGSCLLPVKRHFSEMEDDYNGGFMQVLKM